MLSGQNIPLISPSQNGQNIVISLPQGYTNKSKTRCDTQPKRIKKYDFFQSWKKVEAKRPEKITPIRVWKGAKIFVSNKAKGKKNFDRSGRSAPK
jgi:hypothetical protein